MNIVDYLYEGNSFFWEIGNYPEWLTSDIKSDVETIALYDYGMRKIRPYLEYLTTRENASHVTPDIDTVIKNAIEGYINKNSYKFSTLFATENFQYNPIENYDMTEVMTDDTTETTYGKVSTLTKAKDSQDERTLDYSDNRTLDYSDDRTLDTADETTPDLTDTHTLNSLTNTETDQIEGFNSSTWQDANKKTSVGTGSETNTTTGTSTTTHTGTDNVSHSGTDNVSHSGTDTVAHTGMDTDTDRLSGKDTAVRNYELTRNGNIGVTTSQQMIEQEREVADFSAIAELTHGIINAITIGVF